MPAKRPVGRPRMPKAQRLWTTVEIRMGGSEKAEMIEQAKREGMTLSAWIRRVLIDAAEEALAKEGE